MAIATLLAVLLIVVPDRTNGLARYVFVRHDLPWLMAYALVLYFLPALSLIVPDRWMDRVATWPLAKAAGGASVMLIALTLLGSYVLTFNHPLARDEAMANFDAAMLSRGQLMAPISEEWRGFARALSPEFTLITAGNTHWTSLYFPMNAAFRALFDTIATANLVGPLLLTIALVATYGIALRLWPGRPDAAVVAVLLLGTSSQAIATAMTPFAMTAHLALNSVWVWCFLRGNWRGHAAALVLGFVAIGLHQIVFHPLFVAPFMLMLVWQRQWCLAVFYAVGYGATCLIWIGYWQFAAGVSGAELATSAASGGEFFLSRAAALFKDRMAQGEITMVLNVARLVAWENALIVPLIAMAIATGAARRDVTVCCLLGGAVLTIVAMGILLPYQGHGWGYRYLHGSLGALALVATAGWVAVFPEAGGAQRFGLKAVAVVVLFAAVVSVPGQLLQMRSFIAPFASAVGAMRTTLADVVVVETSTFAFSYDVIHNDPYLKRRPLILPVENMPAIDIDAFCKRYRVALFTSREAEVLEMISAGSMPEAPDLPPYRRISALRAAGCSGEVRVQK